MRTIKFRAWDSQTQQMFKSEDLPKFPLEEFTKESSLSFMQFTGLLDKNGKEIYEGDIVKWKKETIAQVVYFVNAFVLLPGYYSPEYRSDWDEHIEVIGNIYEYPELLKQTNASTKTSRA